MSGTASSTSAAISCSAGPDFDGQIRRLRTYDGVHFTKFGARKLAHYVERESAPRLLEPIPAALTTPAGAARRRSAGEACRPAARPLAGPVILLGTPLERTRRIARRQRRRAAPPPHARSGCHANAGEGRADRRAEAGRADDFSWPPRMPNLADSRTIAADRRAADHGAPAAARGCAAGRVACRRASPRLRRTTRRTRRRSAGIAGASSTAGPGRRPSGAASTGFRPAALSLRVVRKIARC